MCIILLHDIILLANAGSYELSVNCNAFQVTICGLRNTLYSLDVGTAR